MTEAWKISANSILRRIASERDTGLRVWRVAEWLRGRPYAVDALVGGPDRVEQLVVDLRRFDCVTFVESTLALARSHSARGFVAELTRLRYRGGRVDWRSRLHYFSDWLRENHRRRAVRNRTRGAGATVIESRLGTLAGLPERRVRFPVVPKRVLGRAVGRIDDGSVVAFASVRARLDFFHVGLVFRDDDQLTLFHASRSRGRVVAVPLSEFLRNNRMRGIAFAAPLGGSR